MRYMEEKRVSSKNTLFQIIRKRFKLEIPVGLRSQKFSSAVMCHKISSNSSKDFFFENGHIAERVNPGKIKIIWRRDVWNSGNKDGRRTGKQEDSKALVTIDGEGISDMKIQRVTTIRRTEQLDFANPASKTLGKLHLIRDCDFHEKRMAKQAKLNNRMRLTHRTLHNKGIVDSGCSRHMTENKAYLAENQNFMVGLCCFEEVKLT
ncbi:hypothetical protein Tco_1058041 [Tanacetum coccineum]|uniref:Transposase n=1 Tax=Tanacetum coccineum TaxID=301880 RepID=A0ABQ5H8F9_9ASTR